MTISMPKCLTVPTNQLSHVKCGMEKLRNTDEQLAETVNFKENSN